MTLIPPLLSSLTIFFILSVLLPIMINLFKKNIHSFLSFNPYDNDTTTTTTNNEYKVVQLKSGVEDFDIITELEDKPQGNNSSTSEEEEEEEEGGGGGKGIGFGIVDGLMCCTESLGFESGDERSVDNVDHQMLDEMCDEMMIESDGVLRKRRGSLRNAMRSFPPPLKSLNRNGKPSFFLRPERKNGRLELIEVRIHSRPEILHASRHDGRLTLHLIPDQTILEQEQEQEELELLQQQEEEEEEEEKEGGEEIEIIEEDVFRYGKEEERVIGEWMRFPNEGGLRRCHQMVNQHHHGHGNAHLGMCGIIIG